MQKANDSTLISLVQVGRPFGDLFTEKKQLMRVLWSLAALALAMASPGFAAPPLLKHHAAAGAGPRAAHVTRNRLAVIDRVALHQIGAGQSQEITFNLFDDAPVVARVAHLDIRSEDSFTATGELNNEAGGWFVMAVEEDAVVAHVWSPSRGAYQIRPHLDGASHIAEQIDPERLGGCGSQPHHLIGDQFDLRGDARVHAVDSSTLCDQSIDVMVVYTPKARNALGSDVAIRALAYASVASSNIVNENSGVKARLRLVHVALTNYVEASELTTDLVRLHTQNDGHMDEVFALRNQFGADLVALIVDSFSSLCGLAFTMTNASPSFAPFAFSVTQQSCALGNLSFAHELSHNLGCQHDWSDPSSGAFPYSHGHRFIGVSGEAWRTVMAGSPGTRIPFLSNPKVLFDGIPTGVPPLQPNAADNARTVNNTAAIAGNFVAAATLDCNNNGASDACDILSGFSLDLNENGIPDECDALPCPQEPFVKLTAFDAQSFDRYGGAVSMSNDCVVIGAMLDDDAGSASGSAYVYRRDGDAWLLEAKLLASDATSFHHFGRSVAISADSRYIMVGAYRDGFQISDVGAVYIFKWTGREWIQDVKIANPDPEQADWFGWSVAWAGPDEKNLWAVVGAPLDNEAASDAGAVYVIAKNPTGWDAPVKLMASDALANDRLGFSVGGSVEMARVIAGAPQANTGQSRSGAAYVFDRVGQGWIEKKLSARVPIMDARLGWSVGIDGETSIAGAPFDDGFAIRAGAAFVFDLKSQTELVKLKAADAGPHKQFGAAVALRQDHAVIGSLFDAVSGSTSGSAFIFHRRDGLWHQQAKIAPKDSASYDNFGIAVAIAPDADLAIAGAHFDDHHGTIDGGSASVFALSLTGRDCNGNGVNDQCDIDNGVSSDDNANGVPDECEPSCPADVTADGFVNVNDLLAVINQWGACSPSCPGKPCPADIILDCLVNALDLQQVIEGWGACP